MPIKRGYIRCKWCGEIADVMEAEGKRAGELYLICRCGTDQSNRANRQEYYRSNMVATREELEQPHTVSEPVLDAGQDTVSDDEESSSGWLKVLGVVGVVGLCLLGIKK